LRPSVLSRHIHEQSKKGEATEKFNAYVEANAERFIEELKAFCRQPSIAALGIGLEEMGQLVRARLEKLGAGVHLMPVDDGPPVIYVAFIPNPAWRLVWALSTLKGEEDNILVDGFMDRVSSLQPRGKYWPPPPSNMSRPAPSAV
jgi:hypothetical protein